MEAILLTITPEMARDLLVKNVNNRPLKRKHLEFLCEEMRSGRWRFNGDTIRIAADGRLIDGAHRLTGVVLTGVSIVTLLVNGIDPDVFGTIDSGAKRSPGDTLSVAGEKNGRNLAAALVVADYILSGKTDFVQNIKLSNAEILNMLARHPDIRKSVCWGNALSKLATPSVCVALHYIFSLSAPEKADDFFQEVATGVNLDMHNPAYLLRQRLFDNAKSKAKINRRYMAALFIKAWNTWRAGGKLTFLRFREVGKSAEQFPSLN